MVGLGTGAPPQGPSPECFPLVLPTCQSLGPHSPLHPHWPNAWHLPCSPYPLKLAVIPSPRLLLSVPLGFIKAWIKPQLESAFFFPLQPLLDSVLHKVCLQPQAGHCLRCYPEASYREKHPLVLLAVLVASRTLTIELHCCSSWRPTSGSEDIAGPCGRNFQFHWPPDPVGADPFLVGGAPGDWGWQLLAPEESSLSGSCHPWISFGPCRDWLQLTRPLHLRNTDFQLVTVCPECPGQWRRLRHCGYSLRMAPCSVMFLLAIVLWPVIPPASPWIIPQPRANVWRTLANALGQEHICLSMASAEDPMSTCLVGIPLSPDELPSPFNSSLVPFVTQILSHHRNPRDVWRDGIKGLAPLTSEPPELDLLGSANASLCFLFWFSPAPWDSRYTRIKPIKNKYVAAQWC
ncbi:uncharacterized protein LOC143692253 [Agelaius phoeniceus]|uniref:uncharacterized protein LOC143692253 n=1 Tax=Agelaius phoeniceus TaxID=39638 RepID=UPI004054AE9A